MESDSGRLAVPEATAWLKLTPKGRALAIQLKAERNDRIERILHELGSKHPAIAAWQETSGDSNSPYVRLARLAEAVVIGSPREQAHFKSQLARAVMASVDELFVQTDGSGREAIIDAFVRQFLIFKDNRPVLRARLGPNLIAWFEPWDRKLDAVLGTRSVSVAQGAPPDNEGV